MNRLLNYDYKTSLTQLQGKRCNNTVEWLDDDPIFKKWRTSPESSILWLTAKCKKTFLARHFAVTDIRSGRWEKCHDVGVPNTAVESSHADTIFQGPCRQSALLAPCQTYISDNVHVLPLRRPSDSFSFARSTMSH
jgi:hypothetical protein